MVNRRPRRLILSGAYTFVGNPGNQAGWHRSITGGTRAAAMPDTQLPPDIDVGSHMDFGTVIGYGTDSPTFWLGGHETGEGFRESHIAFQSPSREAVQAFFDAAVARGAEVLHEPRARPEYHESYFGAFVRDTDGNNVEAVCHVSG